MKHLKIILIAMLILNIIISICLYFYKEVIRQELANKSIEKNVEEFANETKDIINYVSNGNEVLSKYNGNIDNNTLNKIVSQFMTDTVRKIEKETSNLSTNQELIDYYNSENMSKLTGISNTDINQFYLLVQEVKEIQNTNLEFESAEYDEDSISDDGSYLTVSLSVKYKNVDSHLKFKIFISNTSEYIKFISQN